MTLGWKVSPKDANIHPTIPDFRGKEAIDLFGTIRNATGDENCGLYSVQTGLQSESLPFALSQRAYDKRGQDYGQHGFPVYCQMDFSSPEKRREW
jgi:hypothetical protein